MERELRRLGESGHKNKNQRDRVEWMRANDISCFKNFVEIVAANNVTEQEHACKQAEAANTGYCQSHTRAIAGAGIVIPVADEQEREDAGQLPEHGEQNNVARQDDAEHRTHEGQQEREKTRDRIFR